MKNSEDFSAYILSELDSHLNYYKKLSRKQDDTEIEIERIAKDIIRASDEGEEIERDGFVEMETLRRISTIILTDFVKTSSRIAMLFQVIASFGLTGEVEKRKDYDLIKRIVGEFEFMFIDNGNSFDLASSDIKEIIGKVSEDTVPKEGLGEMAKLLKKQYEDFLLTTNRNAKKADDK